LANTASPILESLRVGARLGVRAQDHKGGMRMEIKAEALKRCELITVSGRIDSATAPDLEEMLLGLIQAGQKNLVVNLRETDFISSAGLKALLSALMKARKTIPPGDVVISEIEDSLKDNFELVGFDRLFTFYNDDTLAVGSF
jgi:anti-sigma B factor antagonist